MTRKRIIFIVLVIALAAGYALYRSRDTKDAPPPPQIVTVARGDIEQVVTSQGKLEPKEYVDVGAQVSGQLEKLAVEIGSVVKKGDLIAEIDPKIYDSRVQAVEARLKTLEAQLSEQAAQTLLTKNIAERNERLFKTKAVSREVKETTETNYKVAQARLLSLNAQLEEAQSSLEEEKANLSFTKIYAPMDGTVVVQTSREGQTLNANQTAPVIVQLADLDVMTVRAQVAEADVLRITPEMSVYFTILGDLNRRWQGKVRQVLPSPQEVNGVVLYDVLVDVENEDRALMMGMTTQMFFVIGEARDALVLPIGALVKPLPDQDNDAGKAYAVQIVQDKQGKQLKDAVVHTGLQNRTHVEIKDGLKEGDRIAVTSGAVLPEASTSPRRPRMGPRI